mgnify:CR=1 FL=1
MIIWISAARYNNRLTLSATTAGLNHSRTITKFHSISMSIGRLSSPNINFISTYINYS